MKTYKESIYQLVLYKCDQCGWEATQQYALKFYKKWKHEEDVYLCDQCEYKLT